MNEQYFKSLRQINEYESDYSLGEALKVLVDGGIKMVKLAEQVEDQLQKFNKSYRGSDGYTEIDTSQLVKPGYSFIDAAINARNAYKANLKKLTK